MNHIYTYSHHFTSTDLNLNSGSSALVTTKKLASVATKQRIAMSGCCEVKRDVDRRKIARGRT